MVLTNCKLTKIALAAVVLLIATIMLYMAPKGATRTAQSGELLVQGLDPAALTKIVLQQGDKKATIEQNKDGAYLVAEKSGYPADLQDVNNLLVELLDIRIASQPKSAPVEETGLDPKKPEGGSVTLFGKDGKELIALQVGKAAGKGVFVGKGGNTYVSEKYFTVTADPIHFIDQNLYAVQAKDIARIDVENAGQKYAFVKGKDNNLQLADLPADKEENDNEIWGVKEGLGRISVEDVRPAAGVEFKPECTATVTMDTTMKYRLAIGKDKDGKYLLQVKAEPPLEKKMQESVQLRTNTGKKELAEKDAVLTANDAAKAFNAKTSGWVYQLSDWAGKRLLTPYDKLLKDKPKPEVKPADANAAKPTEKAAELGAAKPEPEAAKPAEK